MTFPLPATATEQLFTKARTHNKWQQKPVSRELLTQLYDLMKWGPTSANCCPLRIVFVTTEEARQKLKPCLAEGNVEKTMQAPVVAILAQDTRFYDKLPQLFPHADAKSWFTGNAALAEETAFRNSTLQGAYFILAARALGLDCGPMSGFDKDKTDSAFFAGTTFKSNFICSIGYGDPEGLYPRSPRLSFAEACRVE